MLRKGKVPVWMAGITCVMFIWCYGIMTGMSASATRAIIMFGMRIIADVIGRTYDMLTALAVAAVLILLEQPLYVKHCGFLLSFCAVIGISLVLPQLEEGMKALTEVRRRKAVRVKAGGVVRRGVSGAAGKGVREVVDRGVRGLDAGGVVGRGVGGATGKGVSELAVKEVVDRALRGLDAGGVVGRICSGLLSGVAIFLPSFPIQIYFYYQYPIYSILLNLLIVPLMTVVMVTGLAALFLGMVAEGIRDMVAMGTIGMLAEEATGLMEGKTTGMVAVIETVGSVLSGGSAFLGHMILQVYSFACEAVEQLPGAVLVTGQPKAWQMALYYLFLLLFLSYPAWKRLGEKWRTNRGKEQKKERAREKNGGRNEEKVWKKEKNGVAMRLLLPVLGVCLLLFRVERGVEITFLDVGQGDAIYIRSDSGKDYLIDGGSTSKTQVGKYQIVPFLKSKEVSTLEAVFVSHGDKDHCSGVEEMLENKKADRIRIKRLVLPITQKREKDEMCNRLEELALAQGVEVCYIQEGDKITDGILSFECFSPSGEEVGQEIEDRNEESEVLYLTYKNFSALFTGDITGDAEAVMTEQLRQRTVGRGVTLLKVAHHGSRYSTDEEFLDAAQPTISVISCGENNSYGHPHEETLQRLDEAGGEVLVTTESGAITVEIGEEMRVRSWLEPQ